MDADFVDNLKRETWRQWFTSLIHMLEDKTPFEASKTSSGRHKIKELLDMYEGMKSGGSFMDLNVPKDWALWKLGISKYSDGETRFAEEERIFNNSAVEEPAAAPAGDMLKGSFTTESDIKSVTKGIRLCNYCAEPSKSTCSTCRSRYYCCRDHQKADWPDHKKYCVPYEERVKENKTGKEMFYDWKDHTDKLFDRNGNPRENLVSCGGPYIPEHWDVFIAKAQAKGLIPSAAVLESGEEDVFNFMKNKKIREKLEVFKMQLDTLARGIPESDLLRAENIRWMMKSFDGNMQLEKLMKLPQMDSLMTITFNCFLINKKTGMKEFLVQVFWQMLGKGNRNSDYSQSIVFSDAKIITNDKPDIFQLKKALFYSMSHPLGIHFGSDKPHRPRQIIIHNLWGQACYESIARVLTPLNIYVYFQTRQEAERECAEAGTDPDGYNMINTP